MSLYKVQGTRYLLVFCGEVEGGGSEDGVSEIGSSLARVRKICDKETDSIPSHQSVTALSLKGLFPPPPILLVKDDEGMGNCDTKLTLFLYCRIEILWSPLVYVCGFIFIF